MKIATLDRPLPTETRALAVREQSSSEITDVQAEARIKRGQELARDPSYPSIEQCFQIAKGFMEDEHALGRAGGSFWRQLA